MPRPEVDLEYDPERQFVRELTSRYYSLADTREQLRDGNRVIRWDDNDWKASAQKWKKDVFGSTEGGDPTMGKTQSLQVHVGELAPEAKSQKHAHQNEALMYILDGHGYEIHDGKRYEWEAGDLVLIHGGCVHQHFSSDPDNPARILIIKAKPIYLFLHLIYQGYVEKAPTDPIPGWEDHDPGDWGSLHKVTLDHAHKRAFDRLAADVPEAPDHVHADGHGHEHDHDHADGHGHEVGDSQ